MQPYIEVTFTGMARDASVEAAVHRWVARLDAARISIRSAFLAIHAERRAKAVCLKLELSSGSAATASTSRDNIYVAVGDAFRAARRQMLERFASGRPGLFALVFAG